MFCPLFVPIFIVATIRSYLIVFDIELSYICLCAGDCTVYYLIYAPRSKQTTVYIYIYSFCVIFARCDCDCIIIILNLCGSCVGLVCIYFYQKVDLDSLYTFTRSENRQLEFLLLFGLWVKLRFECWSWY